MAMSSIGRNVPARRRARPARLLLLGLAACVGAALCGCAFSAFESPFGTDAAAVARGAALAERDCGGCHGLGPAGVSAYPGARPFRAMRFNYNAISHERAMGQGRQGVHAMPPADLTLAEVGDIGAYVRSLKRAGDRPGTGPASR